MLLFLTPLCTLVAIFYVLIVANSSALLIAKNSALLLTDYTSTWAMKSTPKKGTTPATAATALIPKK